MKKWAVFTNTEGGIAGTMEFTPERDRLVEKMFDAALKEKMNQLARKYDYGLIFELWARLAKTDSVKGYFCKWRWKPNMTFMEGMDCLDDYFAGLEDLLRKCQTIRDRKQREIEKQKM